MKKVISMLISISLIFSLTIPAFASYEVNDFSPYINGYSDGTVKPDGQIQRNEIAKILSIIVGQDVNNKLYKLNDVSDSDWAYGYIYNMVALGIMDLENVEIKAGELSSNQIIKAIYNNSNISTASLNLIEKSEKIDNLPNSKEIYSLVAAVATSANKIASITGENIMVNDKSQWTINDFEDKDLDAKEFSEFTVATFCAILDMGGFKLNYNGIAKDLGISAENIESFDITKADSEISGDFRPGDKLTRTELALALYRILDGSNTQVYQKNAFPDMDSLSKDETIAINYLVENGIIKGKSDGLFHANDTVTRAEVVVMVNRAFGNHLMESTKTEVPYDLDGHWSQIEFMKALA